MEWSARHPPRLENQFYNFIILVFRALYHIRQQLPALRPHVGSLLFRLATYPFMLMSAALLTPLLLAAGAASFWLFYRAIGFFDRI